VQEDGELIAVSPRHAVRLAEELLALVHRAPARDFVVKTIAKRQANGLPLMQADIVIAGQETRQRFPAAAQYPMHFRKTYFPARLHGDPKDEFDRQTEASKILGIPAPIGFEAEVFRACLLPGTPFDRLSPLGVEPEERAIAHARELPLATAAGLLRLAEEAFASLVALHEKGLAHGDAQLHNFMVCPSPLEILLVDFEASVLQTTATAEAWQKVTADDFTPLLRECGLLQCCLGLQPGPLADMAMKNLATIFAHPDHVRREIDRRAPRPA
jgi:hypothetical protein